MDSQTDTAQSSTTHFKNILQMKWLYGSCQKIEEELIITINSTNIYII